MNQINIRAVSVLGNLLGVVVALSIVAIIGPLAIRRPVRDAYSAKLKVYFAAIDLAFMMVEIGNSNA